MDRSLPAPLDLHFHRREACQPVSLISMVFSAICIYQPASSSSVKIPFWRGVASRWHGVAGRRAVAGLPPPGCPSRPPGASIRYFHQTYICLSFSSDGSHLKLASIHGRDRKVWPASKGSINKSQAAWATPYRG
ncbi:hypothetical protein BRADI_5g14045v3 [Brachypodium distachyon]|uniref:Uncharacterized protein n=1 Tax=Brachypodium distachyon TaxID=15368 RepID=A0A2K2CH45_BRADI|nr:hypothetical protein BRADI_5g14045v3 [Brachypodium distachyon]